MLCLGQGFKLNHVLKSKEELEKLAPEQWDAETLPKDPRQGVLMDIMDPVKRRSCPERSLRWMFQRIRRSETCAD